MTLWSVNDHSTKKIVKSFYKELSTGTCKANALAQAKREYIKKDKAHPYYWAAHLAIGDMQPVVNPLRYSWVYFLGFIVLLQLYFQGYRRLAQKRKRDFEVLAPSF